MALQSVTTTWHYNMSLQLSLQLSLQPVTTTCHYHPSLQPVTTTCHYNPPLQPGTTTRHQILRLGNAITYSSIHTLLNNICLLIRRHVTRYIVNMRAIMGELYNYQYAHLRLMVLLTLGCTCRPVTEETR